MRIEGVEVSEEIIAKAVLAFPPDRSFTMGDLQSQLVRCGVPFDLANRCADRTLQKLRKAGTHAFSGGKWKRRPVKAS